MHLRTPQKGIQIFFVFNDDEDDTLDTHEQLEKVGWVHK